ncbi:MAG: DUF4837 family protein [Prolixibacteraceae bacterium]
MQLTSNFKYVIFLMIGIAFFSCDNNNSGLQKNVTGKAGDLIVVSSESTWNGKPGELIRETLAQEHVALPQDEPIFDLIKVPREGFKNILKSTRNILQVSVSPNVDSAKIQFRDNVWAYPQATVTISAKNEEQFEEIFNENKNKIISYFLKAEQERLQMGYKNYYEKGIYNTLKEDFNLTMKVPPGFVIADQKEDFIWLKYETPEISQGVILYTFRYVSDSAFTENYLLKVRDSVLKANVPGPSVGSYMATERRVEQVQNITQYDGHYASLMRGLWRVKNDFMGGPYISLAVLDEDKQRVVVAFGYVYAPSKDKRNFLRQVQAMIYSMELTNQNENERISGKTGTGN